MSNTQAKLNQFKTRIMIKFRLKVVIMPGLQIVILATAINLDLI